VKSEPKQDSPALAEDAVVEEVYFKELENFNAYVLQYTAALASGEDGSTIPPTNPLMHIFRQQSVLQERELSSEDVEEQRKYRERWEDSLKYQATGKLKGEQLDEVNDELNKTPSGIAEHLEYKDQTNIEIDVTKVSSAPTYDVLNMETQKLKARCILRGRNFF
jgi:uncharacterized FlaG/YvyC family protein